MAGTATYSVRVGVTHDASSTVDTVKHRIPDVQDQETAVTSVVAEFTGNSSHNVAMGTGGVIKVDGTNQADPVTGAAIDWDYHRGVAIKVERALSNTAPTNSVVITSNGFCGLNTGSNLTLGENGVLVLRTGQNTTATNGETLTVNLTGTAGYKVLLVAIGKTSA